MVHEQPVEEPEEVRHVAPLERVDEHQDVALDQQLLDVRLEPLDPLHVLERLAVVEEVAQVPVPVQPAHLHELVVRVGLPARRDVVVQQLPGPRPVVEQQPPPSSSGPEEDAAADDDDTADDDAADDDQEPPGVRQDRRLGRGLSPHRPLLASLHDARPPVVPEHRYLDDRDPAVPVQRFVDEGGVVQLRHVVQQRHRPQLPPPGQGPRPVPLD